MTTKLFSLCRTIYKSYKLKHVCFSSEKGFHNHNCSVIMTSNLVSTAKYSSQENNTVSYYDLKKITRGESPDVLIIDVREPKELCDTGVIPESINIPLGDLQKALKDTTNKDFKRKYGKEKPSKQTPIVFSCKSGVRSAKACDISHQLGFTNIKNYKGGWLDWEKNNES